MELNPEGTASVVMDSEDKGESYVDVEIENHRYRVICCAHCGHEITVPIYCGNRFCPVCSLPRASRVRSRLSFLIKNSNPKDGYGIKFLTLTIPSEPDLCIMLQRLVKSFRRLRQRAKWKQRVRGGAFVIEVTWSSAGWHCHIHALLFARYFPFDVLLGMWQRVSTGRGVFIKQIPPRVATHYLTKYLSKPSIPDVAFGEALVALKSYRLFQPFGCWMAMLKDWSEEKRGCPECGGHSFFPLDLIYSSSYCKNHPINSS
jgi:hypothetical protein